MDQPTGSSHLSYTLGILSIVGGLSGFIKTGSKPSFIAGLGIGSLYIYGGHLINNSRSDVGHKVNLSAALLLAGAMGPRYLKSKKIWPAGVLGTAGLMSLLYEGKKTWEWI